LGDWVDSSGGRVDIPVVVRIALVVRVEVRVGVAVSGRVGVTVNEKSNLAPDAGVGVSETTGD
jgi:hypothetical protein